MFIILNNQLGTPGAICPGGAQEGLGKLQGGTAQHNEIKSLAKSGKSIEIIKYLLGSEAEAESESESESVEISGAQLALRFPKLEEINERDIINKGKGHVWHTDGLRQGKIHPFSLLFGVALNDVHDSWNGNLLVWPGTHIPINKCLIGKYGAIDVKKLEKILAGDLSINDIDMDNDIDNDIDNDNDIDIVSVSDMKHNNEPDNLPNLGPPLQLQLNAGDVIILHPDLAHCGGPNFGPDIRYMIYFRIKSKGRRMTNENEDANAMGNRDKDESVFKTWDEISLEHKKNMWSDFCKDVNDAAADAAV